MSPTSLLEKALDLETSERADLAYRLLESLDEVPTASDWHQAWTEEIEARLAAFRSGEAKTFPSKLVFREGRARLADR